MSETKRKTDNHQALLVAQAKDDVESPPQEYVDRDLGDAGPLEQGLKPAPATLRSDLDLDQAHRRDHRLIYNCSGAGVGRDRGEQYRLP